MGLFTAQQQEEAIELLDHLQPLNYNYFLLQVMDSGCSEVGLYIQ